MNSPAERAAVPKEPVLSARWLARPAKRARPAGAGNASRPYRFFWARNAIYHSLRALGVVADDQVLVPAYICAAAVEPIAAYGAKPVFYRIARDGSAELADVEARITPRTRAVLAVHFFGFPSDIRAFRALCDRRRLFLIEDCAHVLHGEVDGRPLGSFGDASVFSWRKLLPLENGGELFLNGGQRELRVDWSRESLPFTLKVAKDLFDRYAESGHHPVLRAFSRSLGSAKRVVVRRTDSASGPAPLHAAESTSDSFIPALVNQPMSRVSRFLLDRFDIARVAAQRRANYLHLHERLSRVEGVQSFFSAPPEGVCPWVFPAVFENQANAHRLLRRLGIPAVSWDDVKPAGFSERMFPDAEFLYQNLVFLPVHQDLEEKHLDAIAEAALAVRERAPGRPLAAAL